MTIDAREQLTNVLDKVEAYLITLGIEAKYSPSQSRDDHGRFGSGGVAVAGHGLTPERISNALMAVPGATRMTIDKLPLTRAYMGIMEPDGKVIVHERDYSDEANHSVSDHSEFVRAARASLPELPGAGEPAGDWDALEAIQEHGFVRVMLDKEGLHMSAHSFTKPQREAIYKFSVKNPKVKVESELNDEHGNNKDDFDTTNKLLDYFDRLDEAGKNYNPDQARDELGRWVAGGGGGMEAPAHVVHTLRGRNPLPSGRSKIAQQAKIRIAASQGKWSAESGMSSLEYLAQDPRDRDEEGRLKDTVDKYKVPKEERVWQNTTDETKERGLTVKQQGMAGEALARSVLSEMYGIPVVGVNSNMTNTPWDAAGADMCFEVKAGLTNTQGHKWVGGYQLTKDKQAIADGYPKMSKEEKASYRKEVEDEILQRKADMQAAMSRELGKRVHSYEVGIVMSNDCKRADVFQIPGFEEVRSWAKYGTDQYYLGTYNVFDRVKPEDLVRPPKVKAPKAPRVRKAKKSTQTGDPVEMRMVLVREQMDEEDAACMRQWRAAMRAQGIKLNPPSGKYADPPLFSATAQKRWAVKFNTNHDEHGRFATSEGGGAAAESTAPKTGGTTGMVEYDVDAADVSTLNDTLKLDSPEAKAMLEKYGVTRDQVLSLIEQSRVAAASTPISKEKYVDAQGNYTRERQAVHDKIAGDMLAQGKVPPSGQPPTFFITGGLPGAGKSTMLNSPEYADKQSGYVHIDEDAIRDSLAQADGMPNVGTHVFGYKAESEDISGQVMGEAIKRGYNITLDGSMKSYDKINRTIDAMAAHGYRTEVAFADLPLQKAILRAIGRQLSGGRFADPNYVASNDHKNVASYEHLKSNHNVSVFRKWNTDVPLGVQPKMEEEIKR